MTAERPLFIVNEHEPIRLKKLNDLASRPVQISFIGKPDAAQILWRGIATRRLRVKSITADSDIAATGSAAFALKIGSTTIATITWAAAGTVATATIIDDNIPINSILYLTAPASQDGTLANGTIILTFQDGG